MFAKFLDIPYVHVVPVIVPLCVFVIPMALALVTAIRSSRARALDKQETAT
ncbi:hypothetical protein HBA54_12580 [Pelagibius litoralis]|uniref:Uncharacterized protein n=1 Tax=Pelagibius litoralis TaxID=374515 RepID=A0A967EXV6_9PROT|nr:hypothetical protein [Pelagibius litoralis]NIA69428.1 hypothetical protein [Pelagibius litoralis]